MNNVFSVQLSLFLTFNCGDGDDADSVMDVVDEYSVHDDLYITGMVMLM